MRLPAIGAPLRAQLVQISLVLFSSAALLLPLVREPAPGESVAPDVRNSRAATPSAKASARPLPPLLRDPFVHEPSVQNNAIRPLVRDIQPDIRLLAVATGAGARALIERGGTTFVVRVGNSTAGVRIAAILPGGIRLEGGRFLGVEAQR